MSSVGGVPPAVARGGMQGRPSFWWDTPDAPAPPQSVSEKEAVRLIVGVRPASPINAVVAHYRVDQGIERRIRGYRLERNDPEVEYFRIDFPPLPAGSRVAYRPVLENAGHRMHAEVEGDFEVQKAALPKIEDHHGSRLGRIPFKLDFLAHLEAPLSRYPEVIGETPDGLRITFPLASGGSLAGPRLNGRIDHHGADWMRIRPDGIGISDVNMAFTTSDGAMLIGQYSGIADFGVDGMANVMAGKFPKLVPVQNAPRFLTASSAYAWLDRLQLFGIGFADMSQSIVRYDIYSAFPERTNIRQDELP